MWRYVDYWISYRLLESLLLSKYSPRVVRHMICVCNDLSSITMPLVRHARTCLTCSSCLQLKQPESVWQYWKSQTAMKWTPGMARGLPVVSVVFFVRTRSMPATNTQWQLKWWMWMDQVAWTSLVTLEGRYQRNQLWFWFLQVGYLWF